MSATTREGRWVHALANALGDVQVTWERCRVYVGYGLRASLVAYADPPIERVRFTIRMPDEEPTEERALALAEELHEMGYPRP